MKKISIMPNMRKAKAKGFVSKLNAWLRKKKIETVIDDIDSSVDGILVIGGDGTLLNVARRTAKMEKPILGINLGSFGFLTDVTLKKLYPALDRFVRNRYPIEERMLLAVRIFRKGKKIKDFFALNDVVVKNGLHARVIKLELEVNNKYVATYFGDGLIVSTPTGSTAYSLAANGPVVHPGLPVFILVPICAHTLTLRPLIISSSDTISVRVLSNHEESILTVDGQENLRLDIGDKLQVVKAKEKLKLASTHKEDYFSILRKKLKWGGRK